MENQTRRVGIKEFILIIVVLLQIFFLFDTFGLLWFKRVIRLLGHEARERSAVYAFGNNFSEYISFLQREIPEDGLVIKPVNSYGTEVAYEGIMRYFLMPREIGDCPVEGSLAKACYIAVGDDAYILAVGIFPGDDIVSELKDFIPFQPEHFYLGLYIPRK